MKSPRGRKQGCGVPIGLHDDSPDADAVLTGPPFWKRCLDVTLILMAVPMWVPLMLGIAAGIKLLSTGPVVFRQERVGFRGRRFLCLKFRTMRVGAPTHSHEKYLAELIRSNRPMTKLDANDTRLIPMAWLLRSTGLDELPQLFNILWGEMSLVGPRPCTPQEYDGYTLPQRARTEALPGLTGLWQVSGKNRTTFNEMIELDVDYVRTQCLRVDFWILFRTPVVLCEQLTDSARLRKRTAFPADGKSVKPTSMYLPPEPSLGRHVKNNSLTAPCHSNPSRLAVD